MQHSHLFLSPARSSRAHRTDASCQFCCQQVWAGCTPGPRDKRDRCVGQREEKMFSLTDVVTGESGHKLSYHPMEGSRVTLLTLLHYAVKLFSVTPQSCLVVPFPIPPSPHSRLPERCNRDNLTIGKRGSERRKWWQMGRKK